MVTRTPEGDALQEMTATLNEGISEQGTPSTFGDAMSSANFVSPQTVRNAMSKGGDSDYIKVSNMMSAVKSHISTQSTQEKVTQRFNEFVIKLHDLRLENLAQLLVERLRKNACLNGIDLHVTAPFGNGGKLEPIYKKKLQSVLFLYS